MQIIEIITVRVMETQREPLLNFLESRIDAFQFPETLKALECHAHVVMSSDISIHLIWKIFPGKYGRSDLCLLFEDGLKEFGLVDCNTWVRQFRLAKPSEPEGVFKTEVKPWKKNI